EFGDLDAVLAAGPSMKPSKMRDNLIEHEDKARLSRELVRLICDSPLPEPLDELALKGIPEEPLREFLEHHGFRTLLTRLGAQGQAASAPVADETTTQREVKPEPRIDRSLYDLAKKHLDHGCIAFKELGGTGQKQITFNRVQLDRATEYAAEDADVALRLWLRFKARMPFERVTRVYELVDRPMVAVVGAME